MRTPMGQMQAGRRASPAGVTTLPSAPTSNLLTQHADPQRR